MAAVQWSGGKMHGAAEAKASLLHDDKMMRMFHGHTNPDIDVTKTGNNYSYRGLSYIEKCRRYDTWMDSVKIKRKSSGKNATVTLQKLVIPIPADMQHGPNYDEAQVRNWTNDVCDILNSQFGDLFIDADVHVDEIHQYINPAKDQSDPERYTWSRVHIHAAIIPCVVEYVKDADGKSVKQYTLNAKKFSAKSKITSLNSLIQEMTKSRYGMPFMTGAGKGSTHHKVEDLKMWTAEAMRAEGLRLADERQVMEAERKQIETDLTSAQTAKEEAEEYAIRVRRQANEDAKKIKTGADTTARIESKAITDAAERMSRAIREAVQKEIEEQRKEAQKEIEEQRKAWADEKAKMREARIASQEALQAAQDEAQEILKAAKGEAALDRMALQDALSEAEEAERARQDEWTKAKSQIDDLIEKVQKITPSEPPPGLVAFAKSYKRTVPKRGKYNVGTKQFDPVLGADGKPILETHNCYDDWVSEVRARQRRADDAAARLRDISLPDDWRDLPNKSTPKPLF